MLEITYTKYVTINADGSSLYSFTFLHHQLNKCVTTLFNINNTTRINPKLKDTDILFYFNG